MNVAQLIEQLARMFPRHADEVEAWAGAYARRLGRFNAEELDRVAADVLDTWKHGYPPKPEDFRAAAPPDYARGRAALRIVRDQWDRVYALRDRLVGEWEQWHAERLAGLDRFQRWHVMRLVQDQAFLDAQSQFVTGQGGTVDIPEDQWQRAFARAASQRPILKGTLDENWQSLKAPAKALGLPAPAPSPEN